MKVNFFKQINKCNTQNFSTKWDKKSSTFYSKNFPAINFIEKQKELNIKNISDFKLENNKKGDRIEKIVQKSYEINKDYFPSTIKKKIVKGPTFNILTLPINKWEVKYNTMIENYKILDDLYNRTKDPTIFSLIKTAEKVQNVLFLLKEWEEKNIEFHFLPMCARIDFIDTHGYWNEIVSKVLDNKNFTLQYREKIAIENISKDIGDIYIFFIEKDKSPL